MSRNADASLWLPWLGRTTAGSQPRPSLFRLRRVKDALRWAAPVLDAATAPFATRSNDPLMPRPFPVVRSWVTDSARRALDPSTAAHRVTNDVGCVPEQPRRPACAQRAAQAPGQC